MWSKVPLVTLVPVKDLNRAIKFYTKTLGAELEARGRGQMRNLWAGLSIGPNLVWLVGGQKPEKRELAYSVFLVKNLRRTVKKLQGRGLRFQRAEKTGDRTRIEGVIAWERWGGAAFFKDSEGNLMMVWENIPPM